MRKNVKFCEDKKYANNINKSNSGISMVALVVTIIVLIILAGISIMQISGDEGILKRAGNSKVVTSISQIEEEANIIYVNLLKDYDDPTLEEVKEALQEKGYTVKRKSVDGEITGITLSKKNMDLYVGDSDTIKVTYKMSGHYKYYVELNGNDYEMTLENDQIKLSNKSEK